MKFESEYVSSLTIIPSVRSYSERVNVDSRMLNIPTADKYMLKLVVGSYFYANQAQFEMAKRDAERLAVRHLYKDVFSVAQELRIISNKYYDSELNDAINRIENICLAKDL